MRNDWLTILCAGILVFITAFCSSLMKEEYADISPQSMDQMVRSLSGQRLRSYAQELSSEKYAGRLSGTQEYKQAAEWVASFFEKWEMTPAGENGTYLQPFPNSHTIVFEGGELAYHYDPADLNKKKYYQYEQEYYPGSESGSGAITAEVVYVGYGIYAPELDYNDYEQVDVKGKIVFMEPGVPVSPKQDPEEYKKWSHYSLNLYKVKMAAAQGAKALLYHDLTVDPNTDYVKGFLVSQVGDVVANDIFSETGYTLPKVRETIQQELTPQSFETGKIFTMENLTEHHAKGTGYNVMGLIPGADPEMKDEVIIGAHLDHVGFCYEVMPGANDNASGMAVLLGVAKTLSQNPFKLGRSVLFVGFGGKEQGFLGSQAYLKDPVFPVTKTALFINLDIVGSGHILKVFGAQDFPDIWKAVRKTNRKEIGIQLIPVEFSSLERENSDADFFYKKKVPTLFFQVQDVPEYIHTTQDTADKLNPKLMQDLTHLLSFVILDFSQK
ncbi:MAG: M28 family peptidase [Candidatus Aminicenantes bacterium]|nr:M28 family peptidase [Candidatus Aminicenantes bacterium]